MVPEVTVQGLCAELDTWPWPLIGHFVLVHIQIIPPDLLQPGDEVLGRAVLVPHLEGGLWLGFGWAPGTAEGLVAPGGLLGAA